MKRYYNLFFLLLIMQVSWANPTKKTQKKVIDKSFPVNAQATLKINNQYGNINLSTWDGNTVKIHVEITVDGRSEDAVQERLNAISILFSANRNSVSAKTEIKSIRRNHADFSINYFVKLPKTNNLDIHNLYGNFSLNQLSGSSNIHLEYGNMTIGSLLNTNNSLHLEYVTHANIEKAKKATLYVDYGNLKIEQAQQLTIKADYTDVKIGTVNQLTNNMDYGSLFIEKAHTVYNESDYTDVKVGKLQQVFVSTGDYGDISIQKVLPNFSKIAIKADYADVTLGLTNQTQYTLLGNFEYGDFSYPSNLNLQKKIIENTSSSYEGKVGNGAGKITLNLDYGDAKIKLTH